MQLSSETLRALLVLIHKWTGISLGEEKDYLIRHRLAPVVRGCGFAGYDELLLRLQASGSDHIRNAVVEAIVTKETSFFRDAWLFEALARDVLPSLCRGADPARCGRRIRVLSAGSSTGQEAYSLAMLVREFATRENRKRSEFEWSILGIDISDDAVEAARIGLYSAMEVARGVSEDRVRRHFSRNGKGWAVHDDLRSIVQFRKFNLLESIVGLGLFDLILCRNVLIYFDDRTREGVCRSLSQVTRKGGWLAIGSAESLHGIDAGFEAGKHGRAILYRKS